MTTLLARASKAKWRDKSMYVGMIVVGILLIAGGVAGLAIFNSAPTPAQIAAMPPEKRLALVTDKFSDDEYQTAAIKLVYPKLERPIFVHTQEDVDRIKAGNDALRPWADSIEDIRMKRAVNKWLDFENEDAEERLKSWNIYHDDKSRFAREQDAKDARVQELLEIVKPLMAPNTDATP